MRIDRTFAFVDLCGFTSFTEVRGDAEAVQVLARFRSLAREIASRRGVRLAKWLGDGVMLVGVESPPVIAAVLELEDRMVVERSPLSIRAGVQAGAVISFEGEDYIGTPVNLASRLCDVAKGHEVVVHETLASSVPPWAAASDVELITVPGFSDTVPVRRLVRVIGEHLDPVCGLAISSSAVAATRTVEGRGTISFCSEACADAWDGNAARARLLAEGA